MTGALLAKELRELLPLAAAIVLIDATALADYLVLSSPDEFRWASVSFLLDQSLAELRGKAAKLERKGKPITPELKNKIAKVKAQRDDSEAFIEKRRIQKAELAAQFDVDLNRYRELKGLDNKTN